MLARDGSETVDKAVSQITQPQVSIIIELSQRRKARGHRALDDIRGRATSCEFEVDADPSRVDPTRVNVDLRSGGSSSVVPRDVDHNNGWDYSAGMRSVILYGPACERVTSDKGAEVRIVFGCPTQTPG